jgi:hypothetical protein
VAAAQPAGTTRRQTEGAPAARLARWALRAVITVTALGALAACTPEPGDRYEQGRAQLISIRRRLHVA